MNVGEKMSKAADMAKISAKGGFHLLWGLVISTVISSVGTIFIANLLGSDQYGLYTIVLTVPTLIGIFRDWGVNSAVIRYTAQYRAENREDEIRSIFVSGLIFEIALGLILLLVSFGISNLVAGQIYNRPEIAPLIQVASVSILAQGLTNAATAVFTGMEKMELNSIMLIAQSTTKTFVIIGLVLLGLGTAGATIGYTAGFAFAGVVGIVLIWTIYRRQQKPPNNKLQIKAYTQTMLQYGIPLSLSTIISGFLTQFYVFLLPIFYATDNVPIGNYGVASTFVVLITFFAYPITTMLFPAFSKLDPEKDKGTLKNVYQFSIRYASLLVVPIAAMIMSLSEPAISTLFRNTYQSAPLFLSLLSITYLYTAFGNLTTGNFINSQGKTTFTLYLTLLTAAIGFPMGYTLIMQIGVLGLIFTVLVSGLPSIFISLWWIRKHYSLTVDWKSSAKILLSSAIAAIPTYWLVIELNLPNWARLITGVVFYTVVFITAALLTRTINKADLENLRTMTSTLGPIGSLLDRILKLAERLMIVLKL
jgi:O-antigen/teichoic acid export membrane protein